MQKKQCVKESLTSQEKRKNPRRCFKGYFINNAAHQLMGRCFGGTRIGDRVWGRCRYLERCLGMPAERFLKIKEDSRNGKFTRSE